ncbi:MULTISPECIES: rhodanese-like domain-containing protein [Corallincola]|uniref:Rhodanese-like domain-containing protein n=3 Tax=Corallincola TaxID=1775176 RepID=A0A368NNS9_9GAMM|nr:MULTISPECIES: rhodanese-like domain-containing protein [Corallincola]RCU51523.1 rhodanese-like domain-containing protein [Corallincola holothuriorum]TAA47026.1 rhodanese-like domain-containing protein [Corallincola spongiicola]TCI04680.1 rhodanese-like domain-containing protein [Corallincola luteus]
MKRILVAICALWSSWVAAGEIQLISQQEWLALAENNPQQILLDVRSAEEYAAGHIPGAINISYDELDKRWQELDGEQQELIVVYCRSGRRAGIAEALLQAKGFTQLRHLEGDLIGWKAANLPLATTELAQAE